MLNLKIMDEKIMFSARIDPEIRKALKHLSVDTGKNVSDLAEEAFRDLLKKYEEQERQKQK